MNVLIFQGVVILAIVLFLAFLAYDDRRNTREREKEDRERAQQEEAERKKSE